MTTSEKRWTMFSDDELRDAHCALQDIDALVLPSAKPMSDEIKVEARRRGRHREATILEAR